MMRFDPDTVREATSLLDACRAGGLRIATAESCTGGLVAACLTDIAGSSDVVECGFVTYSNDAKTAMLGVPASAIAAHGAVSAPVAMLMAQGALLRARVDLAVAITGIAGPGGGSAQKPVGLVHFAACRHSVPPLAEKHLFGAIGRNAIRLASLRVALRLLRWIAEHRHPMASQA